uniref:Major sperm protein n=1 Tax=Caenorhabditis japonica TaxID=281687 RepID=A0A8R1E1Q8_CAEJA
MEAPKKTEKSVAPVPAAAPAKPTDSKAPAADPKAPPAAAAVPDGPFVDAGPSADPAMSNKPDEPAFKLQLSANKIEFPPSVAGKPVSVTLRINNVTAKRITFKVRCTSADIFRVHPPIGFIPANTIFPLKIWYTCSAEKAQEAAKKHFFAFYHKSAIDPKVKIPAPLWKDGLKDVEGVRRIPVIFPP